MAVWMLQAIVLTSHPNSIAQAKDTRNCPSLGEYFVDLENSPLSIFWNPPQEVGSRFKQIKKSDYASYEFVVIDTDASPEDSLCLISDTLPDIILIPIANSRSHALEDMPPFLSALEEEIDEKI